MVYIIQNAKIVFNILHIIYIIILMNNMMVEFIYMFHDVQYHHVLMNNDAQYRIIITGE